jgi:hypothetical protein
LNGILIKLPDYRYRAIHVQDAFPFGICYLGMDRRNREKKQRNKDWEDFFHKRLFLI